MDNATRRQLLDRHKQSNFPGSIIDVYKAYDQGVDLIAQFQQQMQPKVANTPQQRQQGLRPQHQAGNTNASMAFPNTPPNASFNTVGMKAPINIKQFDQTGNLVKSYDRVPPGITDLKMSSKGGTVIETPAQMKTGGVKKYQSGGQLAPIYTTNPKDPRLQAYNDSLDLYNSHFPPDAFDRVLNEIKTDPLFRYYRPSTAQELNAFSGEIKPVGGTQFDTQRLAADAISDPNTPYSAYVALDENGKEVPNSVGIPMSFKRPVQPVIHQELAPLTPRSISSNTYSDKELQESNVTLPKSSGREAQPMMRADFSKGIARQGQYQIGERYWDDDRKRWKEDRWSPEEIKESKRIAIEGLRPPGKYIGKFEFGYGGKRKYQGGGTAVAGAMPTNLEIAAANQLAQFANPELKGDALLKENDPRVASYIDNNLMNISQRPWLNSQQTDEGSPWSAATVSNLMQAEYPNFPSVVSHAEYINDVLEGDNLSELNARRTSLQRDFLPGSVIIQGRGENKNSSFKNIKNNTTGEAYYSNKNVPLHGDVIIGVNVDSKGNKTYQVQGGNMGDSLYVQDMTEKEIRQKYPMVLERKFGGPKKKFKTVDRRSKIRRK
jgi:uncharacterized membrane protein (UPF0127 family)